MISHNKKFLFVHIPKTAGESILRTLYMIEHNKSFTTANHKIQLNGIVNEKYEKNATDLMGKELRMQHSNITEYKTIFGDDILKDYYKFAFVRNPWDALVSTYKWGHKNFPNLRGVSFESFINDVTSFTKTMRFTLHRPHTCVQYDYIYEDGECSVDFVGKFESLQKDFDTICDKIGLAPRKLIHQNNSGGGRSYKEFYTPELKQLVEEKFEADISTFNYTF